MEENLEIELIQDSNQIEIDSDAYLSAYRVSSDGSNGPVIYRNISLTSSEKNARRATDKASSIHSRSSNHGFS